METHIMPFAVTSYDLADQPCIRGILTHIGWEEQHITSFERAVGELAARNDAAIYVARRAGDPVGFCLVEMHAWNHLAQIQGLAVDPSIHRQGVATLLVIAAERFARNHGARGIYVDTPVDNERGRCFYEAVGFQVGYTMPRYYADAQDGVTYQRFFDDANV